MKHLCNPEVAGTDCHVTDPQLVTVITDSMPSSPISIPIQSVTVIHGAESDSQSAGKVKIEHKERGQWGNRAEFFLSCVGLSVGIGNVWRFPYLAYQNGGGAFLIPYLIILFLVGKPLYFMELAVGQYSSLGPWTMFKRMCPVGAGVGVGMCVVCIIICIYYNVLMSYTIFFMAAVLKSIFLGESLPWDVCHTDWANQNCFVRDAGSLGNPSGPAVDLQLGYPIPLFTNVSNLLGQAQPSSEQYFERFVLQVKTKDMDYTLQNPGNIIWQLALCLIFCWIIVFFCLYKGIQSSGKVVYFTSTFPYVILLILMIRGVLLDGAVDGILYLFKPQWDKLLDVTVWRSAASQVFFSLSVSQGSIIMFGSYNKFHMRVYKDAIIVCSLDTITSIIAGIVIFSVLGNLAYQLDVPISSVAKQAAIAFCCFILVIVVFDYFHNDNEGPGLAFAAYPEALSKLPVPQLWAILFFFMLFILGLDSEFGLLETALTAVYDEYPRLRERKAVVTGAACTVCFLLALPCITHAGLYVIDLMDTYGGGFAVVFIAFFEIIIVFWTYGMKRLLDNMKFMMQYSPSLYFRSCWIAIGPIILLFIFIYSMADYKAFATSDPDGNYPQWADAVGWLLALASILQIPIWACIMIFRQPGMTWRQKLSASLQPTSKWGPTKEEDRLEELMYHGIPLHYGLQGTTSSVNDPLELDLYMSYTVENQPHLSASGLDNPAFINAFDTLVI